MASNNTRFEDDESEHSDFTVPDDAMSADEFSFTLIDLTGSDTEAELRDLPSFEYRGLLLSIDTTVELLDGDFLLIKRIAQRHATHETFLEGHLFRRTYKLEGLLEKKRNELVWIQQYNPNKGGDIYQQSLQCVDLHQIIAVREMILTNHAYPTGSYRDEIANVRLDNSTIIQFCRLVCRWKYLSYNDKAGCLSALEENEADAWYRTTSTSLKSKWRGLSLTGGSCLDWLPGEREFDRGERGRDLDLFGFRQSKDPLDNLGQRYTFGDAFCGAGGVSRGAKAAGLRVLWGFDFDKKAIDSYRLNFFDTCCWFCSADHFITAIMDNVKVDILHLSFPCQPFSPAHVHAGRNDDANEASFFSLEGILKRTKPRVVMVEETFGLLRRDRAQWFRAMIQVFTKQGFSVRWKIFNLLEYGLPGRRQRLFVYASCPGEVLPDFPVPTHGGSIERLVKPYLANYRTINDAIDPIPEDFSLHKDSKPCNEPPYNGNVPRPNTICTGSNSSKHPSSRNIHPSGKRTLTSRELASMSGFPPEHQFGDFGKTELHKQIGNAVPPVVAKIFLEQIVKSLQKVDGEIMIIALE